MGAATQQDAKRSASLSCSFGLFGLSVCLHETNQMDQTD